MYPLESIDGCHYLSASIMPAPRQIIDAATVFSAIYNFQQDDLVDVHDVQVPFLPNSHFNLKTFAAKTKREAFAKQLKHSFWNAFLETRLLETTVYVFEHFVVACSAALDGSGGCMIWINMKAAIGRHNGEEVFIHKENVTILYASHRQLII